ncbi:hypothetical protein WJX72_007980 [[Myrmecia] bisecta]|uniref:Protein kinase domain-containing protein n=1 Tax=[Myrmecia] bisecta TaxID=41462 RepID=A0AAW1R766_9CHLO
MLLGTTPEAASSFLPTSTTIVMGPRRMLLQAPPAAASGGLSSSTIIAITFGSVVGAITLAVVLACILAAMRRKTHGHCVRVRELKAARSAEAAKLGREGDPEATNLAGWDKMSQESGITAVAGHSLEMHKSSCSSPPNFKSKVSSNSSATLVEMPWSDWELDPSQIEICKKPNGEDWVLGAGSYGKVYKAVLSGVHVVAVKIVPSPTEDGDQHDFRKEVSILRSCHNAHVVQFIGACMQLGCPLYLVTELMTGGSLWAMLHNTTGRLIFWSNGGKQVALDAARGIAYLHSRNIVHLDIKPANVLLSDTGRGKIADVGISHVLNRSHVSDVRSIGTFAYIAPELLMGTRMSVACDIFSFGTVLWEIVTGKKAKRGERRTPRVPRECPQEVADLIERCCAFDPADRPSIKEVIEILQAAPPPLSQRSISPIPSDPSEDTGAGTSAVLGPTPRPSLPTEPLVQSHTGPMPLSPSGAMNFDTQAVIGSSRNHSSTDRRGTALHKGAALGGAPALKHDSTCSVTSPAAAKGSTSADRSELSEGLPGRHSRVPGSGSNEVVPDEHADCNDSPQRLDERSGLPSPKLMGGPLAEASCRRVAGNHAPETAAHQTAGQPNGRSCAERPRQPR